VSRYSKFRNTCPASRLIRKRPPNQLGCAQMADLLNATPSTQTAVPTSDGRQSSRQKRSRTSLACSRCRGRKTRCDGKKPACSECVRKGLWQECTYKRFAFKLNNLSADVESQLRRDKSSRPTDHHGHSRSASGPKRTAPPHERPSLETGDSSPRAGQGECEPPHHKSSPSSATPPFCNETCHQPWTDSSDSCD
jgi:Fungal Zn(2)-Cys(6) binuclear cluster domain